jgi:hypothetical protein
MVGKLVEIRLGESDSSGAMEVQSFNNDFARDEKRNSFYDEIPSFNFHSSKRENVPSKYLHLNVHYCNSDEIYKLGDKIVVGEYCNNGVIVPREYSIVFNQLYNCSPLISLLMGWEDKEYLSFLHTWAIRDNSDVIDKQVKHWMGVVSNFGDISETVFAPRERVNGKSNTKYENAIDDIAGVSRKTIILTREINEIVGVANTLGVYFRDCGYHLWGG